MADSPTVHVLPEFSDKTSSLSYVDALHLLINKWSTTTKSTLPLNYLDEFKSIVFFVSTKNKDGRSHSTRDIRYDRCGKWDKGGTPSRLVQLDGQTYTMTVATFSMKRIGLHRAIYDLRKEEDDDLNNRCLIHVYSVNGIFNYATNIPPPHGNSKKKKPFYGKMPPMVTSDIDKELQNNSAIKTYNKMVARASEIDLPPSSLKVVQDRQRGLKDAKKRETTMT